jgi:alkanesulfonate monooxygenase
VALSRHVAGRQFSWPLIKRYAQKLEQGKLDAFFLADHLALLNRPMSALKRRATVTSFDPLTLHPALAVERQSG